MSHQTKEANPSVSGTKKKFVNREPAVRSAGCWEKSHVVVPAVANDGKGEWGRQVILLIMTLSRMGVVEESCRPALISNTLKLKRICFVPGAI
eukprot:scaffold6934_cov125-Skeletonema_menzelii.AAC.2